MALTIDEFLNLRDNRPLLDVRSEGEFHQGHMRGAINIPLLNNEERVIVGTTYKQNGQAEAIRTGFKLVGPRLADMVDEAMNMTKGRPSLVYCWRGGMRSSNFGQFVGMGGLRTSLLEGGYKAFRQHLNQFLEGNFPFVVITGCTGSGKSEILHELKNAGEQVIDLEALACHKGSAFGAIRMPAQPTSEQFQNNLFEELYGMDLSKRIWIEDEGFAIGKVFLPSIFWNKMHNSPLIQMVVDRPIRTSRLTLEYGDSDVNHFLEIMSKIVKKLGGQHYNEAKEKLLQGDWHHTIDILLNYYDRAYLASIDKRASNLVERIPWDGLQPGSYALQLIAAADQLVIDNNQ